MRNEIHLSSKMALDRAWLHPWIVRLQRNFSQIESRASDVIEMTGEGASHYIACLL